MFGHRNNSPKSVLDNLFTLNFEKEFVNIINDLVREEERKEKRKKVFGHYLKRLMIKIIVNRGKEYNIYLFDQG